MKLESKFKSAFLEVLHMNPNKLSIQHEKDLILHEKCVKKEKLSNTRHIKKNLGLLLTEMCAVTSANKFMHSHKRRK